jgi:hypothetical protein
VADSWLALATVNDVALTYDSIPGCLSYSKNPELQAFSHILSEPESDWLQQFVFPSLIFMFLTLRIQKQTVSSAA